MKEMRPCPKCQAMLDADEACRNGWRAVCGACGAQLMVIDEELGEETCIYFEEREATANARMSEGAPETPDAR